MVFTGKWMRSNIYDIITHPDVYKEVDEEQVERERMAASNSMRMEVRCCWN
uniref:Uncharacterized protein n=1 Tax=Oryza brachyantha TaxID=4533 RepID=J3MRZ7_ORYBR